MAIGAPPPPWSRLRVRLLLVDDSPLVRRMVRTRLAKEDGLSIVEAASVREAGDLSGEGCDAALLDLELGDGTGVDVARAVLRGAPGCRIAFFTTASGGALADEARSFGPVFVKPHELAGAVAWLHAR